MPEFEWHAALIMMVGPIKHWWGQENGKRIWNSPKHLVYTAWREFLFTYLWHHTRYTSYRADVAIKGPWSEKFQVINDAPLSVADALLNLTPPGAISQGTNGEIQQAHDLGIPVLCASPPEVRMYGRWWPRWLRSLLWRQAFLARCLQVVAELDHYDLFHPAVMQDDVMHTLRVNPSTAYIVPALVTEYAGATLRIHYRAPNGHQEVCDSNCTASTTSGLSVPGVGIIPTSHIAKIEVLAST